MNDTYEVARLDVASCMDSLDKQQIGRASLSATAKLQVVHTISPASLHLAFFLDCKSGQKVIASGQLVA